MSYPLPVLVLGIGTVSVPMQRSSFAGQLWTWLTLKLGCGIDLTSFTAILKVCDHTWSSQVKDTILAAILNVISVIWHCRNQLRFDNKVVSLQSAINLITAAVSLIGNASKGHMSSCIDEFYLLKSSKITGHASCAPSIKDVVWSPPPCFWVKCNSDGAARGAPGIAARGKNFRDYRAATLGCFATNLGVSFSLHAELIGAMIAIEHASAKKWPNFLLESDSQLVVAAFKSNSIVPWSLRNRWNNCVALTKSMNFHVSHVYRKGNSCTD